jgi:hypothetical protein
MFVNLILLPHGTQHCRYGHGADYRSDSLRGLHRVSSTTSRRESLAANLG